MEELFGYVCLYVGESEVVTVDVLLRAWSVQLRRSLRRVPFCEEASFLWSGVWRQVSAVEPFV